MIFNQSEYQIRCEWGIQGITQLAPISDAVIIVDVMSFSTCVSVAVARGAIIYPYQWQDESRISFAQSVGAELAGHRGKSKYSLSPVSLQHLTDGFRLVLPSPNGSSLSLSTGNVPTFAGCLRNARAVAQVAMNCDPNVAVIPAGEKWQDDNSLRPALEDLIGAGAIISYLNGSKSPEAIAAENCFRSLHGNIRQALENCTSGKELRALGYERDLDLIDALNADDCAPILENGAFVMKRK